MSINISLFHFPFCKFIVLDPHDLVFLIFRLNLVTFLSSLGKLELENLYVVALFIHALMRLTCLLYWQRMILHSIWKILLISCRQLFTQLHLTLEPVCVNGTHLLQLFGKNICITPVQVFKLDFVHWVTREECLGQVMVGPLEAGVEGFFLSHPTFWIAHCHTVSNGLVSHHLWQD